MRLDEIQETQKGKTNLGEIGRVESTILVRINLPSREDGGSRKLEVAVWIGQILIA